MRDGYGNGSCFLNAALQGIFACVQVRQLLRRHFDRRKHPGYSSDLWHVELNALRLHKREAPNSTRNNDDRLAVSCTIMYMTPLDSFHRLRSLADLIYDGHQMDAVEAIQCPLKGLLDPVMSPVLTTLFRGHDEPQLHCACGRYSRPVGGADSFTSLQLPLVNAGAVPPTIDNVQGALDKYLASEAMDEDFTEWQCGREGCQDTRRPMKRHCVKVTPRVLCLTLMRWTGAGDVLMHAVRPDAQITLEGDSYTLRSVVVHMGATKNSGHYVTLARHVTDQGNWWLYDDEDRREASVEEVNCTTMFKGEVMKAYILFYEKTTPDAPICAMTAI
jgi:ubiquitin C-terminal hydrolase